MELKLYEAVYNVRKYVLGSMDKYILIIGKEHEYEKIKVSWIRNCSWCSDWD